MDKQIAQPDAMPIQRVVHRIRQSREPLLDLLGRQPGIPEHDAAPRQRACVWIEHTTGVQRIHADPRPPAQRLDCRGVRHAGRQLPEQVHPAGLAADLHVAVMTRQRVQQVVPPLPVGRPHAQQVRHEAAAADELRHRRLFQPGTAAIEQCLGLPRAIDQQRRDDHVAKPQAGPERLRECAEMDGAVGRAGGECRRGGAGVAEISAAIVLHDQAAGAPRPGDDLVAAWLGQRVPNRKLVCGGQIQQCRRPRRKVGRHQPLLIHRHAGQLGTGSLECRRGSLVAGGLDCR